MRVAGIFSSIFLNLGDSRVDTGSMSSTMNPASLSVSPAAARLRTSSYVTQIDRYGNVPRQAGAADTQAARMCMLFSLCITHSANKPVGLVPAQIPLDLAPVTHAPQIRTLHTGKHGLGNAGKCVTKV